MAVTIDNALDVAVLCGGPGAEREVSLESGAAVAQGLQEAGWRVRNIDVSGSPSQIQELCCDAAFLALHGEFGEDGTIQALLEELNIPYTGTRSQASAFAMDKDQTKRRLRQAGLPTADWCVVQSIKGAENAMHVNGLECPVVVKPNSRGSSVGVSIVKHRSMLPAAIEKALAIDSHVMIESFVDGPELTIGFLDNGPLPVIEMRTHRDFYDYDAKYKDDDTEFICPAKLAQELTKSLSTLCMNVIQTLGIEHFGRVDVLLGQAGPMVLEVNTIPGFTSHSLLPLAAKTAGISFPELTSQILQMAIKRCHVASGQD